MAVSFQCMTKSTTNKKKEKKRNCKDNALDISKLKQREDIFKTKQQVNKVFVVIIQLLSLV